MSHQGISRRRAGAAIAVAAVALATALAAIIIPGLPAQAGDVAASVTIRKNVKDLTSQEKREYVQAVLKAKATPIAGNPNLSEYDQFVKWHIDAFRCEHGWTQQGNMAGAAHNSPTFLPWHREFLQDYENMLRRVSGNPKLALPYWDWSDPESTKAVFSPDFMGGNGNPAQGWAVTDGPFAKGKWRITIKDPAGALAGAEPVPSYLVRNFGTFINQTVELPTPESVAWSLRTHTFDHSGFNASSPLDKSFRNRLEGWREAKPAVCENGFIQQSQIDGSPHALHNLVHIYVGGIWKQDGKVYQGSMAYNTSPNDPVFFLHHANIDRIWAAWELLDKGHYHPQVGAPDGFNGTDTMWPWHDRTINSWFGTERNGFRYASLPAIR